MVTGCTKIQHATLGTATHSWQYVNTVHNEVSCPNTRCWDKNPFKPAITLSSCSREGSSWPTARHTPGHHLGGGGQVREGSGEVSIRNCSRLLRLTCRTQLPCSMSAPAPLHLPLSHASPQSAHPRQRQLAPSRSTTHRSFSPPLHSLIIGFR